MDFNYVSSKPIIALIDSDEASDRIGAFLEARWGQKSGSGLGDCSGVCGDVAFAASLNNRKQARTLGSQPRVLACLTYLV